MRKCLSIEVPGTFSGERVGNGTGVKVEGTEEEEPDAAVLASRAARSFSKLSINLSILSHIFCSKVGVEEAGVDAKSVAKFRLARDVLSPSLRLKISFLVPLGLAMIGGGL